MPRHTHEETGIAADNTDTDRIGVAGEAFPEASVEIVTVLVEQTSNSDAEWNIELNGNAVFSSEQTVSAADTVERFTPDQNRYTSDETAAIEINKSNAAASADSLNVTVVTDDGR